jgi:hypothetical protein
MTAQSPAVVDRMSVKSDDFASSSISFLPSSVLGQKNTTCFGVCFTHPQLHAGEGQLGTFLL